MSDLQNSPPPKKRSGLKWFLGGIGLVILLLLVLCCGGIATVGGFTYYQIHQSVQFMQQVQTPTPVKYSGPKMAQADVDKAYNRCVVAMEEVRDGKIGKLTLTDTELNNLAIERIDLNPDKKLGGLDITARPGGVKGKISLENPDTPGTWITLDVDLDLEINGSNLTFAIKSLKDAKGQDAPMAVRAIGEKMIQAGLVLGWEELKNNHNQTQQNPTDQVQPTSPLYGLKTLKFDTGTVNAEVDPARVKIHNQAVGKPDDAPLFGDDKDE